MFLLAVVTYSELPIRLHIPDIEAVFELARTHNLTAYDASYLWLAKELGANLVTLDKELACIRKKLRPIPSDTMAALSMLHVRKPHAKSRAILRTQSLCVFRKNFKTLLAIRVATITPEMR